MGKGGVEGERPIIPRWPKGVLHRLYLKKFRGIDIKRIKEPTRSADYPERPPEDPKEKRS